MQDFCIILLFIFKCAGQFLLTKFAVQADYEVLLAKHDKPCYLTWSNLVTIPGVTLLPYRSNLVTLP